MKITEFVQTSVRSVGIYKNTLVERLAITKDGEQSYIKDCIGKKLLIKTEEARWFRKDEKII